MTQADQILNEKSFVEMPDELSVENTRVTVKEKWQGAVTGGSGFVAVPMALLSLQTKLKLTPTDMNVLINFLAHWWDPGQAVYPRSTTISKRIGVTKRTVQRSAQKMVKAGLIERVFLDDGRRAFHFEGLAARLAHELPLAYLISQSEVIDQ